MRGGRIEAGAGIADGKLDVPVLAGHGHGKPAGVAVPDGVGACLLGDAQQGVLDGRGDGDVVEAGVDGDAEPFVVGRADLLQGRGEPGTVRAGRAQLDQQRLHVAQCLLADALDRGGLLIARVGPAHPGGDHPQAEQVLGDHVMDLPREPGPLRGARVAGRPLRSAASAEPSWRVMMVKFVSSRPTSSRPEAGRVTV